MVELNKVACVFGTAENQSIAAESSGKPQSTGLGDLIVRLPSRKNHTKTKAPSQKGGAFILSMGYKKDIFGSFAYEFELSHKNLENHL